MARIEAKGQEFVSLVESTKESYHHVSLDDDQYVKHSKVQTSRFSLDFHRYTEKQGLY